jgi:hypothetical protein
MTADLRTTERVDKTAGGATALVCTNMFVHTCPIKLSEWEYPLSSRKARPYDENFLITKFI